MLAGHSRHEHARARRDLAGPIIDSFSVSGQYVTARHVLFSVPSAFHCEDDSDARLRDHARRALEREEVAEAAIVVASAVIDSSKELIVIVGSPFVSSSRPPAQAGF